MKVLVIGGGGREHALAWKLAQSKDAEQVFVAPGNAGTAREAGMRNVPIAATDIEALLEFAKSGGIDLTVVGPEDPLAAGLVDRFEAEGCRVLGPRREAAQLESSKGFSKDFMARHGIPTARYERFTDFDQARRYLSGQTAPIVVKADGLAAGKGVVVAASISEAEQAASAMLQEAQFKEAGQAIVIEEYLEGQEASFICLVDGTDVVPLATSQDHKARDDGNRGPNTGGMGAYSPTPLITPDLHRRVLEEVIQPTVRGLASEGANYRGFLYAGLMLDAEGNPKVLEYNCRFGDPETQPIMLRLDSDLLDLCFAATEGRLNETTPNWDPRPTLGVVLAIRDYPGGYPKGVPITGLDEAEEEIDVKVFHAGTMLDNGRVVTNGGRVLCVGAKGDTLALSKEKAYRAAEKIQFEGKFCRSDIGAAALAA
ncbi:MAG: phosphoribosylamine--glycine ligase [Gammaproteobacteria bacterium]|nr:phosphoribosylamine--glycine ligase [Gammaproteobacteria bacterium]